MIIQHLKQLHLWNVVDTLQCATTITTTTTTAAAAATAKHWRTNLSHRRKALECGHYKPCLHKLNQHKNQKHSTCLLFFHRTKNHATQCFNTHLLWWYLDQRYVVKLRWWKACYKTTVLQFSLAFKEYCDFTKGGNAGTPLLKEQSYQRCSLFKVYPL